MSQFLHRTNRWIAGLGIGRAVTLFILIAVALAEALAVSMWLLVGEISLQWVVLTTAMVTSIVAAPITWYSQTVIRRLEQSQRQLRELTEHLVAARQEAESANRMKSEFLANMSHELRTPLNAIIGFSEIMDEELFGPVGDRRYREYVRDIVTSANHLLRLINDILDISRIEAGRADAIAHEPVDLEACVDSALRLMRPRAQRQAVLLEKHRGEGTFRVWGDERRLRQVMLNLLSNAVKFTPGGGTVDVTLETSPAGGLTLRIRDTGIGIAPADIPRALAPFGQIDDRFTRRYDGTGLGLPIAAAMVQAHGGRLELESEPGAGTTVSVAFPASCLCGPAEAARIA